MKYSIKKLEINNFSIFEENKLPARSYFIPYTSKEKLLSENALTERYGSDIVSVLSGEWKFKYFSKISRLPSKFDTDTVSFDTITVPSTWQRTGYENPCYLNTRYPFPMTLPNVPDEMSCGVYVKNFTVENISDRIIITFLGVCSSLTLYVNGKYVGYSEGSHNTAEFCLDGFVNQGDNEILVIVSKWSNGTYLECQDMFRENGIFRDVYITYNPSEYIYDFHIITKKAENGYNLSVDTVLSGDKIKERKLLAELFKDGKIIASCLADGDSKVTSDFGILDVSEWSAEAPELYTLVLSLLDGDNVIECAKNNVGFRDVKIEGELFRFNSKLIKFKGVNHHDTHETTGYVMSPEDLLKDVMLMKEFNVNAVRTSHYPPDPVFLNLCDEYGLYVIDEADIETHGTQVSLDLKPTLKNNIISNDKQWLPRYEDRVMRMYERDKNHPSVTMWSLGNESGGWKNHDECYNKLKALSDIPVHYEGAIRTPRGSYDVISEMYQVPALIKKIGEHKLGKRYKNKPYFLCEYCHAMGVGPGSLEDYWSLIYANDNLTGGCIWEWADHSVYDEKAKYKYTYGGDHGEKYHDDNFCVDGLFYPDRTPHTGAYEMKNVYRPIRCERLNGNTYRFTNTNSFLSADYLKVRYEVLENGAVIDEGEIKLDAKPLAYQDVTVEHTEVDKDKDFFINFIYSDIDGREIAKEQIILNEAICSKAPEVEDGVELRNNKNEYIISFDNGYAAFSKKSGIFTSYNFDGKELIADSKGFIPNIYRPYLDNDRNIVHGWRKKGFNDFETIFNGVDCNLKSGKAKVKAKYKLNFKNKTLFDFEIKYSVYSDGKVYIKAELERSGFRFKSLEIPRFGVNVKLDKSLQNVEYYGLGECENLCDFKAQSTIGIFSSVVEKLNVDYIRPQDNGNHGECRYVKLSDSEGRGVLIEAYKKPFSFSVHNHSDKTIDKARHIEDIKDESFVSVNIDGFMRGTGSNSCGPNALKQYRTEIKDELEFSFLISPLK